MSGVVVRPSRPEELAEAGQVVRRAYQADGWALDGYGDTLADTVGRAADAEIVVAASARPWSAGASTVPALGAGRLVLSSDVRMAGAHRLYQRLGFVREPGLDWSPYPGIDLLAYARSLAGDDPA